MRPWKRGPSTHGCGVEGLVRAFGSGLPRAPASARRRAGTRGAGHSRYASRRDSGRASGTRRCERLRILREELRQSEQAIEALAKRRAERLAASDAVGADEAQGQRARLLEDIDALKREIGTAQPHAGLPAPLASNAATLPVAEAKPATVKHAPPAARWWDVYTRATPASAKPVSLAAPAGADATRQATTRRLE